MQDHYTYSSNHNLVDIATVKPLKGHTMGCPFLESKTEKLS